MFDVKDIICYGVGCAIIMAVTSTCKAKNERKIGIVFSISQKAVKANFNIANMLILLYNLVKYVIKKWVGKMTNMSIKELLDKADGYKKKIEESGPLGVLELKELDEYFRIGLTYSSNALEGNTLTISETKILIEEGITIGGKPIKDCYEAIGHAQAYDYMLNVARTKDLIITEDIIKKLHFLFYNKIDVEQAGQYRNQQVYISGTEYLPPIPDDIPILMKEFINEINDLKEKLHPIEYAAIFHKKLVDIHPFVDGNGRTARLLMNLILINAGYGIVSIAPVLRNDYINSLIKSQREKNPDITQFIKFITECVIDTQRDYCRLLRIK